MGDHLNVPAEESALALPLKDVRIDLAGGDEITPRKVLIEHTLVGAEVHVAFGAVIEHEDLAVAEGVERAGVDVEVALHLDGGDVQGLVLEQLGQGGAEDSLAQPRHHGADDRDEPVPAPLIAVRNRGMELGGFPTVAELPQEAAAGVLVG